MAAANDSRMSDTPLETRSEAEDVPTTNGSDSHGGSATITQFGADLEAGERAKRKRQPRNSACQSCAALKMKCIATSTPGVCERCHRMNRECLPAVPKPRKRRATEGFEPRNIPLSDLLDDSSPRSETLLPPPRAFMSDITNGDVSKNPLLSQPDLNEFGSKSFMRLFAQGLAIDDSTAEYLLRGIDFNFVRRTSNSFRHMAAAFPFISVPYVDPASMIARRPVTSVAICAVASASQPDVQARLSQAFRHVLATRCIVEGERSLDLMVGLLIYLAWHHHYYHKQQIYQELCLLAGMATDLGIQRTPSLGDQARGSPDQETQRAFLGVYYLTVSLSQMAFNQPIPMSWTSSLDHFASALFSSSSREINLQPMLDLAHLLEDHGALLAASPPGPFASSYTELAIKSSISRLKALGRMHPSISSTQAYAAAAIHIYARALAPTSANPTTSNLTQIAISLKDYIDELLSRPPLTLHHFAIVDWVNMFEVLILIARLASPHFLTSISSGGGGGSALGWENSALASMLHPDSVLDAVCNHMASAPPDGRHGPRHETLLSWLRGMCDSIKRRILHERHGSDTTTESHFETVSSLDRHRRGSTAGIPQMGHEEGRFRAVNASPGSTAHAHHVSGRPPSIRSPPRAVADFGFDLFGGGGLLNESFWAAFGSAGGGR